MRSKMYIVIRNYLSLLVVAALALGFAFGTGGSRAALADTSTPTIAPSENTVRPTQTITVFAIGFAPNDTVSLFLDNTQFQLSTLTCDSTGSCSGPLTIPIFSGPQGQHMLIGEGSQFGEALANAPITINPIVLFDHSVAGTGHGGPGTTTLLVGTGFATNETVSAFWGDATGTLLGTTTSDSFSGFFQLPILTPLNVAPGKYRITVVRSGQKPATVSTTFTVVPPEIRAPAGVRSGHILNVHLKGFQGNENIVLSWNANGGQQIGIFQALGDGSLFTNSQLFAPSAPEGSYTLTATGQSSGLQASTPLNVGPGIQNNAPTNPGGTITILGGGFSANEDLTVSIVGENASARSVTTAADGSFQVDLTAPLSLTLAPAQHFVLATNSDGSERAKSFFFIVPSSIRWTGTDSNAQSGIATFGSTSTISGQDFPANEQITLFWNFQQAGQVQVGTVQASADGSFSFDLTTPSSPFTGSATIEGIAATSTFAASFQVQPQAAISVTPLSVPVGQTINISGGSFAANAPITLTLQGNSSPVVIGTATSADNGTFSISLPIPANAQGGVSAITASDGTTSVHVNLIVQVTVTLTPDTGGSGTPITFTASNLSLAGVQCFFAEPQIVWFDPVTGTSQIVSSICPRGPFVETITAPNNLVSGRQYEVELLLDKFLVGQATFTAQ